MIFSGTFNNEKELEIHQHMLEVNGACSFTSPFLKEHLNTSLLRFGTAMLVCEQY